jgi:hypothetical protein
VLSIGSMPPSFEARLRRAPQDEGKRCDGNANPASCGGGAD